MIRGDMSETKRSNTAYGKVQGLMETTVRKPLVV